MTGYLVYSSFLTFAFASVVYAANNFTTRASLSKVFGYIGTSTLSLGLILMTAAIVTRWQQAGRPPFSNMYESLILFSWAVILIYLVFEVIYKTRIVGVFAAIVSAMAIATASFFFKSDIEPLVPALQSAWLTYHVISCFVGYAAFAVSAGVSISYLVLRAKPGVVGSEKPSSRASELMKVLHSFNYETIRFGFLFLGIGIITGAVWANEAWGTYWSWDVKETWSLITWIVYAIVIHFKYVSGRFGVKDLDLFTAFASIVGFAAVIFTYFGVNFLLSGLHSYA